MIDKNVFGEFIKANREEREKTLRGFAAEIGIAPAYLSDIEKGNRNPPEKYLQKIIEILNLSDSETDVFYDLVGKEKNGVYPDLTEYMESQELSRGAMRRARDKNLSDDFWQDVINKIDKE